MKSLILLVFITACGSEMDKAAAKKIEAYPVPAEEISDKPASTEESQTDFDVKISRPGDQLETIELQGCGDFAMPGDFRAAIDPGKGAVLSIQMNPECDSASFRYADGILEVDMCSNNIDWLLAKKTIKTRVTQMAIIRENDLLKFEYHANGKTEVLDYISIRGEFENDAAVCLERLD